MLFKPELNETAKAAGERVARVASREKETAVRSALGANAVRAAAPRMAEAFLGVFAGGAKE